MEKWQTLMFATSEWGLGSEVRDVSSFLRVRTRPECPENSLRELMCDSNTNCGVAKETKRKDISCKML